MGTLRLLVCLPVESNGGSALLVMAGCHGPVGWPVPVADWSCR
jgi:hypothetical protein